jgi:hypothetical protein
VGLQVRATLDTGESHIVDIINPDRIRWDRFAMKHKMPKFSDVPFIGQTFLAWAALTRLGKVACSWDEFCDRVCVDCEGVDPDADEDGEPQEPDPTRTAAGSGT